MLKNIVYSLLIGCTVICAGCALGPDYARPEMDMPEGALYVDSLYNQARWWETFDDPLLNKLEEEALANNRSLTIAMARVEEASAMAGIALADRFPQASVGFGGTREQLTAAQAAQYGGDRLHNAWQANGIISFELDIWGKYRRLDEAARAELLASEAARDTVMLTLTADVAHAYFQMRSLQSQCMIADNMVKTYQETRRIFQARLDVGLVQEIELRRVEGELATNSATLHLLQNSLTQVEGMLSVLTGRSPREILGNEFPKSLAIGKITLPLEVPEHVPSNLLLRRPDIRQAEGTLIAANARIGAARAAFFPSISLTAGGGWASSELNRLFMPDMFTWNFVGNLTQPIFQAGRLIAQEAMAQAQYKQMFATYELAVQNAFRDTREALENNRQRRIIAQHRIDQVTAMERSLFLANKQYEQGTIGLMDLLDVRRNLLRSQLEHVESQQNQLSAVVTLCKSLGGGWVEDKGFVGHDTTMEADMETEETQE